MFSVVPLFLITATVSTYVRPSWLKWLYPQGMLSGNAWAQEACCVQDPRVMLGALGCFVLSALDGFFGYFCVFSSEDLEKDVEFEVVGDAPEKAPQQPTEEASANITNGSDDGAQPSTSTGETGSTLTSPIE